MYFPVQVKDKNDLPDYQLPPGFVLEKQAKEGLDFPLFYDDGVLGHYFCNDGKTVKIFFDFVAYFNQWIKSKPVKSKEILGRAIALKKGETLYDLSCGSGKDSSLFLYWGLKVKAYERNPLVYLLLNDALFRLKKNDQYQPFYNNFDLNFGTGINEVPQASTCFFDPMFGESKIKPRSKGRKEMEFFKQVIGPDEDARNNLDILVNKGIRVILKRPDCAKDWNLVPSHKWQGKTVEYWRFN